jgi:hypothetical protein
MKNLHNYLLLATACLRTELTPEERNQLNRFLRGNSERAE